MRWMLLLLCAAWGLSPAHAESVASPAYPIPLPKGTETRPVQLSKLVVKLNRGEVYGRVKLGLICLGGNSLVWQTGRTASGLDRFGDVFNRMVKEAGFAVIGDDADLMFESESDPKAEFLVGATIVRMVVDACTPNSGLGDIRSAKGKAGLEIEWYLYNRMTRSVVIRVNSSAIFTQAHTDREGVPGLLEGAFAENLRQFMTSGALHRFLIGAPRDLTVAQLPTGQLPPLAMPLANRAAGSLPQVVGSTVLVQSGDGHGSGFLISADGYFLTNHHVVGGSKYVKIRWSDGLEGLGEVVRKDAGRDVALVKGDARGRSPLRVRASGVPVGMEVFAVGAPLERAMQNTVTRGIVSANRVRDGYSFVQSDVMVQPGNSGGPLVDAGGDVVGITDWGMRTGDAPTGLNFFIPAAEALTFLSIVPAAPNKSR